MARMSIQVNGSFDYGTFFNEFPTADLDVYTVQFALRIALVPEIYGAIAELWIRDEQLHYRFNTYQFPNLRAEWDGPTIPITGDGAIPTDPPGAWVWLVWRCAGATDPGGGDWSGNIEWGYIVDGESTYRPLHTTHSADVRLDGLYEPEVKLSSVDGLDAQFESLRVWSRALTDAELVAQSRTSASLHAGDALHYAPLVDAATLAPSGTNGAEWTGTPLDGATRPSYLGDAEPEPATLTAYWIQDMPEIDLPLESSNNYGGRKFTLSATHACDAIPAEWQGRTLLVSASVECAIGFSESASAEIDFGVSASASGAYAKAGCRVFAGLPILVRAPLTTRSEPGPVYLVREAGGDGVLHVQVTD